MRRRDVGDYIVAATSESKYMEGNMVRVNLSPRGSDGRADFSSSRHIELMFPLSTPYPHIDTTVTLVAEWDE